MVGRPRTQQKSLPLIYVYVFVYILSFIGSLERILKRNRKDDDGIIESFELLIFFFPHLSPRKNITEQNRKSIARKKKRRIFYYREGVMDIFFLGGSSSIYKDAAGIAGNIFAFALFVSPMPTFRRIIRNRSTEQYSGLPYVYALLNCLICLWYGSPFVSLNNFMVLTVNSIGAVFQLTYTILFITYVENKKKVRMLAFLLVVFAVCAIIVAGSLQIPDRLTRWFFVGFLSCGSLVSMFASPLFVINLVIQTKSVEFMPFYLSLSTFLMSFSFFLYGLFNNDAFVYTPNGIGTILGIVQLALYLYFSAESTEETKEPLIVSYV